MTGHADMDNTDSAAALAIIQKWGWMQWGFDYDPQPVWRPLSDAINSLAFDGHADPAGAFLRLLADDALKARGDYQWRACRNGDSFSQQDYGAIPANWWRSLLDGLPRRDWLNGGKITLSWLGISDVLPAEWDWNDNCISVAHKSGLHVLDDGYTEEHFSAWNINVFCPSGYIPDSDDSSPVGNDECVSAKPLVPTIGHSGGRPPKYDWEGALAHVVAVANTPDGLETGPGAQAAIERLIADHFARASNDGSAPCESQIRKRASRVMKAIEALKPPLSKVA
jgi:hypothetical protein